MLRSQDVDEYLGGRGDRLVRIAAVLLGLSLAGCGGDAPGVPEQSGTQVSQAASTVQESPNLAYYPMVQQLYLAYFGRAADPAGLEFFAQQYRAAGAPTDIAALAHAYPAHAPIRSLVDSFGLSAESQSLYGGDDAAFVASVYRHLFNREPDGDGAAFWTDALRRGALTRGSAALSILAGAQAQDASLVARKAQAITLFTRALETPSRESAYSAPESNETVRRYLGSIGVEVDPATFPDQIEQLIQQLLGMPVTAVLDGTLPSAAAAKVTLLATARGTSTPGTPVAAYAQEQPVLALDADGRILAAGFAAGGQGVRLTSDSTAVALVRLIMQDQTEPSSARLAAQIREAPDYTGLAASIAEAQRAGMAPQQSAGALRLALAVAKQAHAAMAASAGAASRAAIDSATRPFPYTLMEPVRALGAVTIDRDIVLTNTTALPWTVKSLSYTGQLLAHEKAVAELPAPASVLGRIGGGATLRPVVDDWRSFQLRIMQDAASRNKAMRDILVDTVLSGLARTAQQKSALSMNACVLTVAANVAQAPKLQSLYEEPNADNLFAVFETNVIAAVQNEVSVGPLAERCFGDARPGAFIAARMGFLAPLARVADVVLGLPSAWEKLWTLWNNWARSRDVTICIDGRRQVDNCAVRFNLDVMPRMLLGDAAEVVRYAYDDGQRFTGVPYGAKLESAGNGLAFLDQLVIANEAGAWDVRLVDPTTGLASPRSSITVVAPTFAAPEMPATVGQPVTLQLVDGNGQPAPAPSHNVRYLFNVSDSTAAEIVGSTSTSVSLKLLRPEPVTVTAKNSRREHSARTVLRPVLLQACRQGMQVPVACSHGYGAESSVFVFDIVDGMLHITQDDRFDLVSNPPSAQWFTSNGGGWAMYSDEHAVMRVDRNGSGAEDDGDVFLMSCSATHELPRIADLSQPVRVANLLWEVGKYNLCTYEDRIPVTRLFQPSAYQSAPHVILKYSVPVAQIVSSDGHIRLSVGRYYWNGYYSIKTR